MAIFPAHTEVLVSSLTKEDVMSRLDEVTKQVNYLDYRLEEKPGHLFNGTLEDTSFRISLRISRADSFLPLIHGSLEDTAMGSILFLEYKLFPSSVFFLGFWTVISVLLCLFFGIFTQKYLMAGSCLLLGLGNYAFAWTYFKRKIRQSQRIFKELLNA